MRERVKEEGFVRGGEVGRREGGKERRGKKERRGWEGEKGREGEGRLGRREEGRRKKGSGSTALVFSIDCRTVSRHARGFLPNKSVKNDPRSDLKLAEQ